MNKHDKLRNKLDYLNNLERGEASKFVTEILKYIMDSIQPERSKREDAFIYKPGNYSGPIAIDMKPSKECDEYHKNSYVQVNIEGKIIIKRCGALNIVET